MERIEFESVQELAEIMDTYIENKLDESEDNYPIISVYAKCDIAKELIETLILFGNRLGSIIELEDYEMSHYDKEFVVYLTENGVTCEKVFVDDEYRNGEADIVFLHEDCNSRLIDHIDDGDVFEFGFESDEDDEEYTIDGVPATKKEFDEYVSQFKSDSRPSNKDIHIEADGDMHGFSVNHSGENGWSSYSFYSTDMDLVNEMAKMFR